MIKSAAPKIRTAEPPDFPSMAPLLQALGYNVPEDQLRPVFDSWLSSRDRSILLIEQENRILGLLSFSIIDVLRLGGPKMTVEELIVLPESTGNGLGKQLVNEAITIARSRGVKRVELTTSKIRESYERSFYTKSGLAEINAALMRLDISSKESGQ